MLEGVCEGIEPPEKTEEVEEEKAEVVEKDRKTSKGHHREGSREP